MEKQLQIKWKLQLASISILYIGPTLAKDIPQDNKSPTTYMENRVLESMVITPVVEEEVQSVIKSLKDSSAGWDTISSRVIKTTHSSFIVPLTHIMNMSLLKGLFPSEFKITHVIPLFKSGESNKFPNYRPVSVLPLFPKYWNVWCTVGCCPL